MFDHQQQLQFFVDYIKLHPHWSGVIAFFMASQYHLDWVRSSGVRRSLRGREESPGSTGQDAL